MMKIQTLATFLFPTLCSGALRGFHDHREVTQNVALNKPVYVSAIDEGRDGGRAVDGDLSTRWLGEASSSAGQWITVDLQTLVYVSSVSVSFEQQCAGRFDIRGSNESAKTSETWTTLTSGSSKGAGTLAYSFEGFVVRYIQLISREPCPNGYNGLSIYEFRVFGEKIVDTSFKQIAVFAGYGGRSGGENFIGTLADSNEDYGREYNTTQLTSEDICAGKLSAFDMFVVGGGHAGNVTKNITDTCGDQGLQTIRDFIENGGGYLGICSGAFFPLKRGKNQLDVIDAVGKMGWQGEHKVEKTVILTSALGYSEELSIYYNGGPNFGRLDQDLYTSLATYVTTDTLDGAPAIIATSYGKGKLLLVSPHPEGKKTNFPWLVRNFVRYVLNMEIIEHHP